jgi:hypothetical protein
MDWIESQRSSEGSQSRRRVKNMVMSSVRLGANNYYDGEGQQQFNSQSVSDSYGVNSLG